MREGWTRNVGHCWRSKNKLINDVLLWTPTHGHTSVDWAARIHLQLCANTGWCQEELPGAKMMGTDRDKEKHYQPQPEVKLAVPNFLHWELLYQLHFQLAAITDRIYLSESTDNLNQKPNFEAFFKIKRFVFIKHYIVGNSNSCFVLCYDFWGKESILLRGQIKNDLFKWFLCTGICYSLL